MISVLVMMATNILANPLLEDVISARTISQLNMKPNTRTTAKRITLQQSIFDAKSQTYDYTIRAYSTKVCQLRIDFIYLELDQPTNSRRAFAYCAGDRLSIKGLNFDLCGRLVNTHVYVPFDAQRLTDEVVLNFQTGSSTLAMWNMEVNQIECSHKAALVTWDERQAPDGCLQYFYQTSGSVESFNYGKTYMGNTHYAICFNRNYNENAVLELTEIDFEMDGNGATPGFDGDCLDPEGDTANNKKDYIAIPFAEVTDPKATAAPFTTYHSLFCLDSLHEKEVEFFGTGPIVIHVHTDEITDATAQNESGFKFRYRIRKQ